MPGTIPGTSGHFTVMADSTEAPSGITIRTIPVEILGITAEAEETRAEEFRPTFLLVEQVPVFIPVVLPEAGPEVDA